MLSRCGLVFECEPADLDEEEIIESLRNEKKNPDDIARCLAEMKARKIDAQQNIVENFAEKDKSSIHLKPYILGCDQILMCESSIYTKAENLSELRKNLIKLRAKEHFLYSAAAIVRESTLLWSHCAIARIYLRDFSEKFLDNYLSRFGEKVLSSVGGYRVEEEGALLFSRLSADPYVIQGLPLLELLAFLREQKIGEPLLS